MGGKKGKKGLNFFKFLRVESMTDGTDVIIFLKNVDYAVDLAKNFFIKKMRDERIPVSAFKSERKAVYEVLWRKRPQSALTHKNLIGALNFIASNEEELLKYIDSNKSFIQVTKKDGLYEDIKLFPNNNLPYYSERDSKEFLNIHLNLLSKTLNQDQFNEFTSRLLSETIDGTTYTFPSINLLKNNSEITLKPSINLSQCSKTLVSPEFMNAVKTFMPNVSDNETFALSTLDLDNNELTCSVSSYFKTLFSSDRFFYHIVSRYPGINGDLTGYGAHQFLIEWSNRLKDIVINNRFSVDSSIGCSCLCIYKTPDNNYEFLIGKKTAESNGHLDVHVIPSLMFQPLAKNKLRYKDELPVLNHVLRELGEEVFQEDEYDHSLHSSHLYKNILNTPSNRMIRNLLDEGAAEFHLTGVWLDMYRLRPEITSVLIIHDENWFKTFFKNNQKLGNWEIAKGGLMDIEANESNYSSIIQGHVGYICPPGISALISGIKKFKSL